MHILFQLVYNYMKEKEYQNDFLQRQLSKDIMIDINNIVIKING